MFAGQHTDKDVQASIDAVIDAARAGLKPSDTDTETLSSAWLDTSGGEWCADLVSLEAFRKNYEEGFLHEDPVDLTVLADNAIVALVRRLAPVAFQHADPDDIRLCYHPITHSDGEQWVLCSFCSLELAPIGVFETTEDAKAACVAMGYLVGNDGEQWNAPNSMTADIIIRHFRTAAA